MYAQYSNMHQKSVLDLPISLSTKDEARFWGKVDKSKDGCWVWTAGLVSNGYGSFRLKLNGERKLALAHRLAYTLYKGPIPADLELDHLCKHRICVNPDHLEPVEHRENIRRGEVGTHYREKTHCPQGHAYIGENLYIRPTGDRECRECKRASCRQWRRKKTQSKERAQLL